MNIDGKKLYEILDTPYKMEVLRRLKYGQVIIKETKQKLDGTNFDSLLKIIIRSCEQIQEWIEEYKNNNEIEGKNKNEK